jgi:hypothetical protein
MVTADEVTLLLYTQGDTPVAALVPASRWG